MRKGKGKKESKQALQTSFQEQMEERDREDVYVDCEPIKL
jgi:hypothetical protein